MSKISILDLSIHGSNNNSDIIELSAQELGIKGGWLPLLIGAAILLYPQKAY